MNNHFPQEIQQQRLQTVPARLPDIKEMYKVVRCQNEDFGIDGYDPVRNYVDSNQIIKDREFELNKKNLKGAKDKRHVTKRGHFLDLVHIQHPKNFPAPNQYYKKDKNAKEEKPKQLSTKDKEKFKKMTFIDEIFRDNKKKEYPRPSPGSYNIRQTEAQLKEELTKYKQRKIHVSQKSNFLVNYEYLSWITPGPGNFNPKIIEDQFHVKSNRSLSHKEFIKKHEDENQLIKKKHKYPDFGSYNGFSQDFDTFGYTSFQIERNKKNNTKDNRAYMGKDVRFKDITKSKVYLNKPSPSHYNLTQYWPVKLDAKNKEELTGKKNWMDRITKGVQHSIYHA